MFLFNRKNKLTIRTLAEVIGLLVAALGMIYISRIVGPEYVGFSAASSAVIMLLGRLADGGLTAYASQLLARDDESLKQLLSTIAPAKFIISCLLVVITLAFTALLPLDEKLKFFLRVSVYMVIFDASTPSWVFVALGKINVSSVIRIIQSLSYALAIVLFIRRPEDWRHLPYLTLFNSFISFAFSSYFLCHFRLYTLDLNLGGTGYLNKLREYYGQSYHFLKAELSGYVYTTSDRLILYYFTDSHTVGIYEAAYKVINPFYSINGVVTPTFFRDLAQSFKNGDITRVMSRYLFIMSLFSIPLGFYLTYFSSFVVELLYGARFADSAASLAILGYVITFGFTSGIIALPFCAWNMQKQFGISVFWGNVLNTIMNFALIPFWGAIGAAIATLAAKIMVTIVGYHFFKKATDYPVVSDFCWFFLASLVPLVVVVVAGRFVQNRYLLTAVYGSIYFALTYGIYKGVFRKRMVLAEAV